MIESTRANWVRIACLLELCARKPGNVHRSADFHDTTFVDFALAGTLFAEAFQDDATPVGERIHRAVQSWRYATHKNTYLGTAILLAPMTRVKPGQNLRAQIAHELRSLTVEDTVAAYAAIRLANPAGLGTAPAQDVCDRPTIDLRSAMALASQRDLIAQQYENDYAQVFDDALPVLRADLARGRPLETAIVHADLKLMSNHPDSLIARKCGQGTAAETQRRAQRVLDAGWPDGSAAARHLAALDAWLRADGNRRNPGTSADLVAAAIYAALYDGTISLPRDWPVDFAADNPAFVEPR